MSYKRPDTGNPMNDYVSALRDFYTLAPHLLEAKTAQQFDIWLDKLATIDRRSTVLFLKEHQDEISPDFMRRVSVRLGRTWDRASAAAAVRQPEANIRQSGNYTLTVNGLPVEAHYSPEVMEQQLMPLVDHIVRTRPKLVLLAGAPGSGKSTLTLVIEALAQNAGCSLQALGMDGFHHTNAWLEEHGLASVKGAPETFDFEGLRAALISRDRWPVYSRQLHDVSSETILLTAETLLVEGNYLLLDADPWRELVQLADLTVYLSVDPAILHERLVGRKIAGGSTREQAEQFYANSDARNVELVVNHHLEADWTLEL